LDFDSMGNEFINDDRLMLRRYLLGLLSREEGDRVEDAFVKDDALFTLYQEIERELVNEYAAGDLCQPHTDMFESNYLVTDRRRRRVAVVKILQAIHSERTGPRKTQTSQRKRLCVALAFAAGLLAAVTGGIYWRFTDRTSSSHRNTYSSTAPAIRKAQEPRTTELDVDGSVGPPAVPGLKPKAPTTVTQAQEAGQVRAGPIVHPRAVAASKRNAEVNPASSKLYDNIAPPSPVLSPEAGSAAPILAPQAADPPRSAESSPSQSKRRIVVMDFNYSAAVASDVVRLFGSEQDIGAGISELLVDRLSIDDVYLVIKRHDASKEQPFPPGPDGVVTGEITQFQVEDGSSGFSSQTAGYIGGVARRESRATVGITIKMSHPNLPDVFIKTSVIGESTGSGAVSRSGLAAAGGMFASRISPRYSLDMRSTRFAATVIGEATNKAVLELAKQLEDTAVVVRLQSAAERAVLMPIAVAGLAGAVRIFTVGNIAQVLPDGALSLHAMKEGVKEGDRFALWRILPVSERKPGFPPEEMVGSVVVISVSGTSGVGRFIGDKTPQAGDILKEK
jgi:curli biogenesis system outer membrane secretion channel CsgG